MKTKILPVIICAVFTGYAFNSNAQANQHLSNLSSPTAVNVKLLPDKGNKHDLGSANKSWKDLYLDGSLFSGEGRFLAYQAGTGIHNMAVGTDALYSNTTGYSNTAIGFQSLYSNASGFSNTASGYAALFYNAYGSANTADGDAALFYNTTGFGNTASGYGALYVNTTGWYNTATGYAALFYNNTGNANTALGFDAGENMTTGSYNTFIGYNANCGSFGTLTNSTALGNGAIVRKNNTVRIGNYSVTSIGGYVSWSNISDGRVKKNIKSNVPGLAFINKLNPITYNLDLSAEDKIMHRPVMKDKEGNIIQSSAEELTARKEKEKFVYTGFVAQDVEKAAKEIGYDFSGVDIPKNDDDVYGLRYAEFVVPLVKAVQELSKENDELKSRLDKLEALLTKLPQSNAAQSIELTGAARLEQNVPNPFNGSTTIAYYLPMNKGNAYINFYSSSGALLKSVNLDAKGSGTINLKASELPSGVYRYTLLVNGKVIDTKQMVQTK